MFAALSQKHREALDLLIEHKTSKEISRALDISPHTVDQHLDSTRSRLGLANRSELAAAYRRYLEQSGQIYERLTYENFHIGVEAVPVEAVSRNGSESGQAADSRGQAAAPSALGTGAGADRLSAVSGRRECRVGPLASTAAMLFVAALVLVTVFIGFGTIVDVARSILR